MSWNGYPSAVIKSMFKRLQFTAPKDDAIQNDEEVIKILSEFPFSVKRVNSCLSLVSENYVDTRKEMWFLLNCSTQRSSLCFAQQRTKSRQNKKRM